MDLIDREKTYEALTEYYHHRLEIQHKGLREALAKVPTIEPKHGHWIKFDYYLGIDVYKCSECGMKIEISPNWDGTEHLLGMFCENCGAKMMDEVEKDGEERPETHRENA